jgi:diguanylate cyclase (GGDEF)-like protein
MNDREKSSRPPLVLIANDQEWSARSLESILAPNGFAVLRAYTGQQALDRARTAQPDLIILDAQMPDMHGVEVCRALKEDPRYSGTIPIIITTSGPSGRAQRLEAYRAGAWEFLGQPLDGEALLLKLQTFIRAKFEIDRVRDESLLDQLTGLYNMRGLAKRAREIGSEAFRRHHALACIVFSPDPETATSDSSDQISEEHASKVAERVGEIIRQRGRASDAIGRLGRSEFAVIAPATEAEGAVRLMQRLGQSIESESVALGDLEKKLRIRAGYCAVPDFAESSVDAVEMLLRATTALRHLRSEGNGERIKAFEQVPVKSLS